MSTPNFIGFPILRLPFLAQENLLPMMKLEDLIPLSFLSKRTKRLIQLAIPFKKAKYDCTVRFSKSQTIEINSRFGSYTGSEPHVDHIIELLSYPHIRVEIDGEDAVIQGTEWIKSHQNIVKEIVYLTRCKKYDYEHIFEFVNQFIELNVRIELNDSIAFVCSQEEVRIENPTITLMQDFWRLKCRKIRIVDRETAYLAEMFMMGLRESYRGESSIKQLIFEIRESHIIDWSHLYNSKLIREEFQHPIYGKIHTWFKWSKRRRDLVLFGLGKSHAGNHEGKKLMIVDII